MTAVTGEAVALWVGSYTADMDGSGEGITALGPDESGGHTPLRPATPVDSPSFLARHPSRPVLYAASEGAGVVHAFRIGERGRLRSLGPSGTAGPLVCHVAVDAAEFLVACCWGDGSVVVFELEPDGSLGRRHQAPASIDPHGGQRQSRAHSCVMLGGGRFATAEMGHDTIRLWRFDAQTGIEAHGSIELPAGSGPRHFARRLNGVVYVNTEYTAQVAVLAPIAQAPWLALAGIVEASATGLQPGDAAAEICLDAEQRHLYVGVRGSNRICRLACDADGLPVPAGEFDCGGNWPRHHCVDGERLVVALQRSDALAVFTLNADGSPSGAPQLLPTGSPTCVVPGR